jgi:hypothetical protein
MRRGRTYGTRNLLIADVPVTALVLAFVFVRIHRCGSLRYIIVRLIGISAWTRRLIFVSLLILIAHDLFLRNV